MTDASTSTSTIEITGSVKTPHARKLCVKTARSQGRTPVINARLATTLMKLRMSVLTCRARFLNAINAVSIHATAKLV